MKNKIKVRDYVKKKHCDNTLFKVVEICTVENGKKICRLKGITVRLLAEYPMEDLKILNPEEILEERHESISLNKQVLKKIGEDRNKRKKFFRDYDDIQNYFEIPGKVLHLDGDEDYLEKCLNVYKMLDVPARGIHVSEENLPKQINNLVATYLPDIVVITGHDGINNKDGDYMDMTNYKTSKHFVDAIRKLRQVEPDKNSLVIIAGACQSYYEALIEAGANFATSPKRILVHAFDPVYIAEKVAFTSIYEKVNIREAVGNTITGLDGIGGIDTWGHFRLGFPKSNY